MNDLVRKRNTSLPKDYVDTPYALKVRLRDTKADMVTFLIQNFASQKSQLKPRTFKEHAKLEPKIEDTKRRLTKLGVNHEKL